MGIPECPVDNEAKEDDSGQDDAHRSPHSLQNPLLYLLRKILPPEACRTHWPLQYLLYRQVGYDLVGQTASGTGREVKPNTGRKSEVYG